MILLGITIIVIKYDKRQVYEKFLMDSYSGIPTYSKEDLQHIPKPEHPDLATYQNYFMSVDPVLGYVPIERLKEALRYTLSQENNSRNIIWENA